MSVMNSISHDPYGSTKENPQYTPPGRCTTIAGTSREVSGSRKINFLADHSLAISLVVAISPGPSRRCSGSCAGVLSTAVVVGAAVSLPVLPSFADVPRIHHTAIRHTASTPVAERTNHRGGICDMENLAGAPLGCDECGAEWPSASFLGNTPGIFGSAGLNGLLFIPSPAAGFRKGISRLNRARRKRKEAARKGVNP